MGQESEGVVGRRSLLRLGIGAAVAVTVAACGDTVRNAASGPVTHSPHSLAEPSAPPSATSVPAQADAELHGGGAAPGLTGVQQWTGPVHRVPQILPGAPANAIALTIDDGPHPVYTPMVLEVLQHYGVLATFSMIGNNVQQYPQVARQVVNAGHTICNHSMWHPLPFSTLTLTQVHEEVADGMNRIWDATKTVPRLFRAPGGEWSPAVFQILSAYNLIPIDWDVDPRDWSVPGVAHIEAVLDSGRGGDILLCHDGGGNRSETVQALGQVIPALLARKLEFVTL